MVQQPKSTRKEPILGAKAQTEYALLKKGPITLAHSPWLAPAEFAISFSSKARGWAIPPSGPYAGVFVRLALGGRTQHPLRAPAAEQPQRSSLPRFWPTARHPGNFSTSGRSRG